MFSNRAGSWFKKGNAARKRLILEIAGSNLLLKDKTLLVEARKPFAMPVETDRFPRMWTYVQDVRTFWHTPEYQEIYSKTLKLMEEIEKTGEQEKLAA